MRECMKRDPCWLHGALHRRLTLRPAKNIDSGSGSPGDFPISESRTCKQNKCVFLLGSHKKKEQILIVTSKRPIRSLRGAAHRTQHDTALPKHYKNVDGQPTARGAARNRVAKCTWCTAIKGRARQQKVLTSSMRLQGPGQCQRLRRRAPWDVPRGQQRWFHAVEASP